MKKQRLRFGKGFRVALTNARAQVATMSIAPGDAEGSPRNRHRAVDQWLYVLSGTGTALVNGKRSALKAGALLFIERKDRHEIKCTGRTRLGSLNFYMPPRYTKAGNELPRAKP
jgi:mannose-6-phosphate isomerase-like protein (cupin superfamily)